MKKTLLTLVSIFCAGSLLADHPLLHLDFEADTVLQQPNVDGATFSPSNNTLTNGAMVIDSATPIVGNPLGGKSLFIFDQAGDNPPPADAAGNISTHFRFPFNGGTNRSDVHLSFNFQRAAPTTDDSETGIKVALGRVENGDRLNNTDFRPFELRLLNDGRIRLNSLSGTSYVGTYDTGMPNTMDLLANSHDTESVGYDVDGVGSGTLAPNTLHLYLNGTKLGEYDFHVTPDPANAPDIIFNQENNDLGQFALYQDSRRRGAIVFDNITFNALVEEDAAPTAGKFINISTRTLVGTGEEVMIGGFIIREGAQRVLVQARGPELANDGVADVLADPVLSIKDVNGAELMTNDDWEDSQGGLVTDLWNGNPNMAAGSASSAIVVDLEEGSYTAVVEGKDGSTGVALVEVYEIDRDN